MGVVFDEVIATVEAPTSAPQETDMYEQPPQDAENNEENIVQIIEIQQRRARRLWAE